MKYNYNFNINVLLIIILILICILIVKFIYDEYTYISFTYDYLFKERPWAAIPLPRNIKNTILKILKELPPNKYKFIDFGCADGDVIDLVYKNTDSSVCIELEKKLADLASQRFKGNNKIKVLNMDMNDYKYTNEPTILFLYEPLWSMSKEKALPIYEKIFSKLPKNKKPFYIIYVSGIKPHLNEEFFNKLNFVQLQHNKLNRFLGLKRTNVYLFGRK